MEIKSPRLSYDPFRSDALQLNILPACGTDNAGK